MLSYLKALPVILAAGLVTFWLAALAFPAAARSGEIGRLRWAFLLVTVASFLSPSIWVYVALLTTLMVAFMLGPGERPTRAAVLWALLVLAVPNAGVYLPGIAGISNFFEMTHTRALTLLLLLPVALSVLAQPNCPRPMSLATDWFVVGYFAVQLGTVLPYASTTVLVRESFVLGLDTMLPYWLFSRAFTTTLGLNSAMRAFVLTLMVMAGLSVVEATIRWPFYDAIPTAWGFYWDMTVFLVRGGFLRAKASAGHSLIFGFVLVVAFGLWFVVKREVAHRGIALLGTAGMALGLLASLARGAWVGAVVLVIVLMALRPGRGKNLLIAAVGAAVIVAALLFVPAFSTLADLLPFVGRAESENVVYRQRLIEISLALIAQSPWFGVPGYMSYMEDLRQGQGIIDIVNTYIGVALQTGLVGLAFYLGIFASTLWALLRLQWRERAGGEGARVAAGLFATLVGAMAVLATASSIVVMPQVTYMLIGMAVSCIRVYSPAPAAAMLMGARR
jgi:hypothetical protein